MTRKPEVSFKLKEIVWNVAVKLGKTKYTNIQRQLDYDLEELRKKGDFFEDTPNVRTIKRIIEKDINELPDSVVLSQLPPYLWLLRRDYESLMKKSGKQQSDLYSKSDDISGLSEINVEIDTYYKQVPISIEVKRYLRRQLERHFDELAQTAKTLAGNLQRYKEFYDFVDLEETFIGAFNVGIDGDLVIGGKIGIRNKKGSVDIWYGYGADPNGTIDIEPIDEFLAISLHRHLERRFPDFINFRTWQELIGHPVEQGIIDILRVTSHSRNFGFCPACFVCNDLQV